MLRWIHMETMNKMRSIDWILDTNPTVKNKTNLNREPSPLWKSVKVIWYSSLVPRVCSWQIWKCSKMTVNYKFTLARNFTERWVKMTHFTVL